MRALFNFSQIATVSLRGAGGQISTTRPEGPRLRMGWMDGVSKVGIGERWAKMKKNGRQKIVPIFFFQEDGRPKKKKWAKNGLRKI